MAKRQQPNVEETDNVTVEQPEVVNETADNKKGMLFSRLNYAAKYIYNNEECMITPKGKIKIDNVDLIQLPLKPGLLLRKID